MCNYLFPVHLATPNYSPFLVCHTYRVNYDCNARETGEMIKMMMKKQKKEQQELKEGEEEEDEEEEEEEKKLIK